MHQRKRSTGNNVSQKLILFKPNSDPMKLFYFLFLMSPLFLQAQEVFYKDSKGEVYDSITYAKMFNAIKEDSQDGPLKTGITEKLTLVSSGKKKKVYTFQWFASKGGVRMVMDGYFKRGKYQGKIFPLPKERTIRGKTINLKNLNGKPTLINLWFVGCKPCVAEMPSLNSLVEKYKDSVNFISVTYESNEVIENFLKSKPFLFQHIGQSGQYLKDLEVNGYPMNLFLDKNGVLREVRSTMKGIENGQELSENGDASEFEAILNSLIEE